MVTAWSKLCVQRHLLRYTCPQPLSKVARATDEFCLIFSIISSALCRAEKLRGSFCQKLSACLQQNDFVALWLVAPLVKWGFYFFVSLDCEHFGGLSLGLFVQYLAQGSPDCS